MRRAIVGIFLLAVPACTSHPRGAVTGRVHHNGKPLENVLITFLPDGDSGTSGLRASGVTEASGRYRLRSDDGKSGVVAGSYRVIVEDMAIYDAPRDREGSILKMPPQRVPTSWADPLRTPVRKTVTAGTQTIDLDLATTPPTR